MSYFLSEIFCTFIFINRIYFLQQLYIYKDIKQLVEGVSISPLIRPLPLVFLISNILH